MGSKSNFVKLRKGLFDCMYEDSENGLQNIIQSLAWNDSVYRTFDEGLRLAQGESKRRRLPCYLIEYIHCTHTAYVVIALRKLYDNKKKGRHAVNSLRSVTQRIVNNAHLFTRENFVTFDDLPYYDNDKLDLQTRAITQARHSQFDSLCVIRSGQPRKKADRLDVSIAEMLHERTKLRPEIERYANKFLAHSSAMTNRPDEALTLGRLTLRRIQAQYRNVIWSTQQVAKFLCEPFLSEVPTPQFDVLANWENGLFDSAIKRKLSTYWYKRMGWWMKWTNHYRQGYRIFTSPGS